MAGSVNKAIIVGNVGKDPEIRNTTDGKRIATLSVATSDHWKDRNTGERKERTEWHRVVIFQPNQKGLVNVVEDFVKKGSKLYIEGTLQTRKWEKDGVDRYTTEIVLTGFNGVLTLLDSKNQDSPSDTYKNASSGNDFPTSQGEMDDEIPFR